MTKVQFVVLSVLLSIVAVVQVFPIVAPDRAAPKWDYRIEGFKDAELVEKLNWLGDGGWEVVSARRAMDDGKGVYELILRKPR